MTGVDTSIISCRRRIVASHSIPDYRSCPARALFGFTAETQRAPPAISRRGSCSSAPCDEDADDEEDEDAGEPAGLAAEQVQQHQPGKDGEAHLRVSFGAECSGASSLPSARI